VAEGFGADANRYDRARPSYPEALVDRVVAASPGRRVLDVGCGTGIVARLFQAAGCEVLGIEPDPRMADLARNRGTGVEVATIEDWEPAGRRFDAVVAGQSWHWVDPVAGAAKAAEVLRPGGRLVLFWNSFIPAPELNEAFANVNRKLLPELPMMHHGLPGPEGYGQLCDRAAGGMAQAGGFAEPERWRFDWERPYTRDEWLDAARTFGGFNQLPEERQDEMLAATGGVIDDLGGSFVMRYATVAVTALRAAA
jgi:SAM-dependent methyltransferase